MSVTRYSDGMATVTLDGALAAFVRSALSSVERSARGVMEQHADELAATARREWYGPSGVDRETGKSGDIQVVTTIDASRGLVRVSIGSTDTRKAGKTSKPLAAFVHQPWGTSLRAKAVTREDWFAWRRKGAPVLPPPDDAWWAGATNGRRNGEGLKRGLWYIQTTGAAEGHVLAPKGKGYLIQTLVRTPAKGMVTTLAPELGRLLATRLQKGGG
jgi:hypothetical protein